MTKYVKSIQGTVRTDVWLIIKNRCVKTVYLGSLEKNVKRCVENAKLELYATRLPDCVQTDVKITGCHHTVQHVNHISSAPTVHVTAVAVNKENLALWTREPVLMDARRGGQGDFVILFAMMEHMFQMDSVPNVQGFVKTAHLVINLQECVITDVACI